MLHMRVLICFSCVLMGMAARHQDSLELRAPHGSGHEEPEPPMQYACMKYPNTGVFSDVWHTVYCLVEMPALLYMAAKSPEKFEGAENVMACLAKKDKRFYKVCGVSFTSIYRTPRALSYAERWYHPKACFTQVAYDDWQVPVLEVQKSARECSGEPPAGMAVDVKAEDFQVDEPDQVAEGAPVEKWLQEMQGAQGAVDITDLMQANAGKEASGKLRCCCDRLLIEEWVRAEKMKKTPRSQLCTVVPNVKHCTTAPQQGWATGQLHYYRKCGGERCVVHNEDVAALYRILGHRPASYCEAIDMAEGPGVSVEAATMDEEKSVACADGWLAKTPTVTCTYNSPDHGTFEPEPACELNLRAPSRLTDITAIVVASTAPNLKCCCDAPPLPSGFSVGCEVFTTQRCSSKKLSWTPQTFGTMHSYEKAGGRCVVPSDLAADTEQMIAQAASEARPVTK